MEKQKIISEDSVSGPDNRIEEETKRNTDYDADEDKVLVLTELIDQKTVLDDPENILNESTPIEDETIVNKANTDSELRFLMYIDEIRIIENIDTELRF